MNSTGKDVEESDSKYYFTQILIGAIVVCVYSCGVYLHTKIIQVAKKEKDLTWKMDVSNSAILILQFLHCIFMHAITYMISDLYLYTGKWFCYFSKALNVIGNAHTTGHSFIIALMKYVIIVYYQSSITNIKKEKFKTIFLWINLFYPVVVFVIFNLISPEFIFIYDGVSSANRCLGKSEMVSSLNRNTSAIKLHHICDVPEPVKLVSLDYLLFIIKKTFCWLHMVFLYSNVWNVIELLLYIRIFTFMRR